MNDVGYIDATRWTGFPAGGLLPGLALWRASDNTYGQHNQPPVNVNIGTPWYTHVFSIFPDLSCSRTPGGDYNTDPAGYTNNDGSFNGSDSDAHDIAQAMAAAGIPYCTVGWSPQGGFGLGLQFCSNDQDPAYLTDWEISMAGFGTLDVALAEFSVNAPWTPTPRPGLGPPWPVKTGGALDIPAFIAGNYSAGQIPSVMLMRPAPLGWAGQDPKFFANRLIWSTSEVAAVSWTASGHGAGFFMNLGQGLDGFKLGSVPSRCSFPPVTFPPIVIPPGRLKAGSAETGLIRRGGA